MNCFGSRKKNSYMVNEEEIVTEESRVKGKKIKEEQDAKRLEESNRDNKGKNEEDLESDKTNDETHSKNALKKDKVTDKKKDKKLKKKDDEISEDSENQDKTDKKKEKKEKDKKSKKKDEVVADDKKKDKKSTKKEKHGKNQKAEKEEGKGPEEVRTETPEKTKQQAINAAALVPDTVECCVAKMADPDENAVQTDTQKLATEADEFRFESHGRHSETHEIKTESHERHSETHEFKTESHGRHSETHEFEAEALELHTETEEFKGETKLLPTAGSGLGFTAEKCTFQGNDDCEEGKGTREEIKISEHRSFLLQEQDLPTANRRGSTTPPLEDQDPNQDSDQDQDLIGKRDHRRFSSESDSAQAQVTFDE